MEALHSFTASWFLFIADITIKGSFVLAIAILVNSIRKKSSASAKHFIWLLVIVSVLFIPVLSCLSTELGISFYILGQGDPQNIKSDNSAFYGEWNGPEKSRIKNPASNDPAAAINTVSQSNESDNRKSFIPAVLKEATWQMWLAAFWILGMSAFLTKIFIATKKNRKRKENISVIKNPAITDILEDIQTRLYIKRSICFGLSKNQNIAAAHGIFRPVIILPHEAAKWSHNRIRSVILHEMAHIKRFDYLFNGLAYAVNLVFWFNPLIWYAVRRLYNEAERACDDIVVSNGVRPVVYAQYLINSARLLLKQKWVSPLETAMAKKSSLEGRILSIIDEKKIRKKTSHTITLSSILVAAVLVILAACTRFEEKNYTVELIDGVKHIHNLYPKFKDKPKFKLDFVWKIGELEENDENYQFFNAFDASMDKDGIIFIMDSGNHRIQVFDPAGNYLKTIGREGQGPGEFQQLFSMDINDEGHLYVYDRGKRSMECFDREGKLIRSTRLQRNYSYIRITGPDVFCAPLIDVMYPGLMIWRRAFPGREGSKNLKCLSSVSIMDKTKNEFCSGLPEEGITHGSQINANVFETDNHSNLFVAFKHQNRIEKYTPDGRLLFTIDRPLSYSIEYKTVENLWKSGDYLEKFPEFAATYVSERIGIDGTGRIWVVTYAEQPSKDEDMNIIKPGRKVFEIFSPEGILLTRVSYPDENIIFVRMKENHLLFTNKDYSAIYKYRIVNL
ncbi:MAG: M56 family metallopeptidase [Candidatus Aminicenantes bacterium]|jgi:beta-lactamase regulating signal transducer with metallopeptidase domain